MAPRNQAAKRRRTNAEGREQREDRLSSLPDTLLIEILSVLPLSLAITTEVLSIRWRCLWTNVTSIHIDDLKFKKMPVLISCVDGVLSKLTSPFFHSFSVNFSHLVQPMLMESWIQRFCECNLRHIQLSRPKHSGYFLYEAPTFIFGTQSLVSIELNSAYGWKLPEKGATIDLPNLKTLSLRLATLPYKRLKKLIEGCPSLENLSLDIGYYKIYKTKPTVFKCPSLNLRRLSINLPFFENIKVVIKAPKLECLAICARKSAKICFRQEQPIALHEAKIELMESIPLISIQPQGCENFNPKFHRVISNVRILTLNFLALTTVTHFPNVTQLTLTLEPPCNFGLILPHLLQFPKLNVLILKFGHLFIIDAEKWTLLENECVSALRQVKRIEIDTCSDLDHHFSELVEYLLRRATTLDNFIFSIAGGSYLEKGSVSERSEESEKKEYMFCNLLRNSPRASMGCEVLFRGKYLTMSRKTNTNILRANGEVFTLD